MASRIELQKLLESILGSKNVYFQPPESLRMQYPCIRYSLSDIDAKHANNKPYGLTKGYRMVYIDRNPDSEIPMILASLPMCRLDRPYVSDGLNHWAFYIYF